MGQSLAPVTGTAVDFIDYTEDLNGDRENTYVKNNGDVLACSHPFIILPDADEQSCNINSDDVPLLEGCIGIEITEFGARCN